MNPAQQLAALAAAWSCSLPCALAGPSGLGDHFNRNDPTVTAAPAAQPPRQEFRLDQSGELATTNQPAPGTDAAVLAEARRELAAERPGRAFDIIDAWIERNQRTDSSLLPQAYLIRADAATASGNEYDALYDYELIIKTYPNSPEYVLSVERELEIALRYVNGLYRKFLGVRIVDASDVGEELLVRVQERLPGSRLAERAAIELADHYYRQRDMALAGEAYDLFLKNHPRSAYVMRAMQRRIYANIARFKGPEYDSSILTDSRILIRRFMTTYPTQATEAGLDEALLVRIDESAAQQKLGIARYYLRTDDAVSARATLRRLLREHPQTAAAGEATDLMQRRGWLPATLQHPVEQPKELRPAAEPAPAATAPPAAVPAPTGAP